MTKHFIAIAGNVGVGKSSLTGLNQLYAEWVDGFSLCPVLTVPTDDLDFVGNRRHLDQIIDKLLQRF